MTLTALGLSPFRSGGNDDTAMFDEYSTKKLVELRSLCADMVEETDGIQERADALLLLEHIDKELAMREMKQSA
jgi:hypothetical protein